MLALYQADSVPNVAASDSICTALQLTNFWQDVAIDYAKGRIYLPLEHLARFCVSEDQIAAYRVDERWRALLAFETARTHERFVRGRPLVRELPWRLARELAAVIAGGEHILARIDSVRWRRVPPAPEADLRRLGAHRRHGLAAGERMTPDEYCEQKAAKRFFVLLQLPPAAAPAAARDHGPVCLLPRGGRRRR